MRVFTATVLVFAASVQGLAAERVETVDARIVDGQVLSIDDKHVVVRHDRKETTLPRCEIAEVILGESEPLMTQAGQAVLVTTGEDRIAVSKLLLTKGRFRFVNGMLGPAELAMSLASAIYQPKPRQSAGDIRRKCQKMKLATGPRDLLVVENRKESYLTVKGVLKAIEPTAAPGVGGNRRKAKISFRWQGQDRKIASANVRAIMLARVSAKLPTRAGLLIGKSGSVFAFRSISMNGQEILADLPAVGKRTISRKAVAAIRFDSDRVIDLSSLTPAGVREYGFFNRTFSHRRDRSVGGGPLRLDGRTFGTGVGLHSFAELTYALDGRFAQFVAVVGINDAVRPLGDADIFIVGDAEDLTKALRITGRDRARILRLNVAGVRNLTLRVDFGPDGLDVADHVDFAAARLIKPAGKSPDPLRKAPEER